jgi:outer membrane protein OmpA-like peptidoglycan-associated protein
MYDGPAVVAGHTDLGEGDSSLSAARAAAVKDKLVELGMKPERLSVQSWADKKRLVIDQPRVPEPQNRRVEIGLRLLEPKCPDE